MTRILSRFTIAPDDGRYLLMLELEDGTTVEIMTSFEQLDLLSEEIDRRLDEDEDIRPNPSFI